MRKYSWWLTMVLLMWLVFADMASAGCFGGRLFGGGRLLGRFRAGSGGCVGACR
jgi:hypothetical protein